MRNTIDNGGGQSTSGDFSLTGAVGQPDATELTPSGGDFELHPGFFESEASIDPPPGGELIFSDGFEQANEQAGPNRARATSSGADGSTPVIQFLPLGLPGEKSPCNPSFVV